MKKIKSLVCLLMVLVLSFGILATTFSGPSRPPILGNCPYGCCGILPTSIEIEDEDDCEYEPQP